MKIQTHVAGKFDLEEFEDNFWRMIDEDSFCRST